MWPSERSVFQAKGTLGQRHQGGEELVRKAMWLKQSEKGGWEVGRVTEGLDSHVKETAFYSKGNSSALESLEQGSDMLQFMILRARSSYHVKCGLEMGGEEAGNPLTRSWHHPQIQDTEGTDWVKTVEKERKGQIWDVSEDRMRGLVDGLDGAVGGIEFDFYGFGLSKC